MLCCDSTELECTSRWDRELENQDRRGVRMRDRNIEGSETQITIVEWGKATITESRAELPLDSVKSVRCHTPMCSPPSCSRSICQGLSDSGRSLTPHMDSLLETLFWQEGVSRSHRSCRAASQPPQTTGSCFLYAWRGTTWSSSHNPAAHWRSWWCWWSRTDCEPSHSCCSL